MLSTPPRPTLNYGRYMAAVVETHMQQSEEWRFKSDWRYREVLEHVSPAQAEALAVYIREVFPEHAEAAFELLPAIATENDAWGAPVLESSSVGRCSPSNLRYLNQALRLWTHAAEMGMERMHVVEIGGGYGGLALYVHRLAPLFPDLELTAYTILDLPEVAHLQQRMCALWGVPVVAANGLDEYALAEMRTVTGPRFLFSAYAFSEFDADTRAWYEARVARQCSHGVLYWNFVHGFAGIADKYLGGPVYSFVDAPLRLEPDQPARYAEGVMLVRF
jgi:hypothetical protein